MTAQHRDDTVCAILITALRYLKVGIMSTCSHDTLCLNHIRLVIRHSEYHIDLGKLLFNLLLVTLCKAACNDKLPALSCLLELTHLNYIVNTLLFGITDKRAGINYDNICFILVVCELIMSFMEHSQHFLRIDKILVTT